MSLFVSLCSIPLPSIHAQEIMETLPGQETLETDGMEDFKNPTQEVTPQAGKVRAADNIWEGYQYRELEDGTVEIAGYEGKDSKLVIPSEINEKRVTSIGKNAFLGCSGLTQISIHAGVTSIDDNAFMNCSGLTEIIVDSNNPAYASQNGILYDKKREQLMCCPVGKKGKISIPEGVTSIKNWAFESCYKLTEISIPKSVTKIETYGFYGADQNATLLVYKGSYADTYAKKNNFKYKYISCSHTWRETIIAKATVKKNGSITKTCTTCGEQGTETIYAAKAITLSKASYVYNGKNQKPSIIVKDSKEKTLKNKTDYTVTYPKNGKNVGLYTVTVKLKGKYSGTVKKTFQILPKGTTISKITPKKKGFMVQWKKQAAQTTGYEIAYSTNKNFTKKTTETAVIGGNKTVSKSVSKQKEGKKYFVKIRTYKAVKVNGKSKKLYSSWSKVKTVTTKR